MEIKQIAPENRLTLLFTIVERGTGEQITASYRTLGLNYNMIAPGYGAIGLEAMDFLGLTELEKDLVISIGPKQIVKEALSGIRHSTLFQYEGESFALTVPISGISGMRALQYVTGFVEGVPTDESK